MSNNKPDAYPRRRIQFIESGDGTRSAEKVCVRQMAGGELEHRLEGPERKLPLTRVEAEEWNEDMPELTGDEREFHIRCLCGEDWPGNYRDGIRRDAAEQRHAPDREQRGFHSLA